MTLRLDSARVSEPAPQTDTTEKKQESDTTLRPLCNFEPKCNRYAVQPPKGYITKVPLCIEHLHDDHIVVYEGELALEARTAQVLCSGCDIVLSFKITRYAKTSCCKTFLCQRCWIYRQNCVVCSAVTEPTSPALISACRALHTRSYATQHNPDWNSMKLRFNAEIDARAAVNHRLQTYLAMANDLFDHITKDATLRSSSAFTNVFHASEDMLKKIESEIDKNVTEPLVLDPPPALYHAFTPSPLA